MEKLEENTLFLAATRPALLAGVPLPVAALLLTMIGLIMVLLQNPLYEAVMVPLWFGSRILVARDYNAVGVVVLFLKTAGRSLDSSLWGGASVSPNPLKVHKRGRGIV